MARWRAEALARFPELRLRITKAETVMGLWIDLHWAFEQAYRADPRDESMIARVYSYADWCLEAPRGPEAGRDPLSAVVVSFYEDIPTMRQAREDMPRWFPYSEVVANRAIFSYHLSEEEYGALLKHMEKHQNRYVPRKAMRAKN